MSKKREYCNCVFHYVCYMGYVCMNRGCGKPHEFVRKLSKKKRDEIFNDIGACLMYSIEPNGTKHIAWAKKNGSVDEEEYSPDQRRYDERMAKRNWLQKLLNI